jgi:hypothetical protein
MSGSELDLSAIASGDGAASGVDHGAELLAFADAAVRRDDQPLAAARAVLLAAAGSEALVDAAAVIGNFQRMVRIADATGIALDAPVEMLTGDLREELGIDTYASAANTPRSGPVRRAMGRVLRPLLRVFLRAYGRRRS